MHHTDHPNSHSDWPPRRAEIGSTFHAPAPVRDDEPAFWTPIRLSLLLVYIGALVVLLLTWE
jgi:hypothetical protein